LSHSRHREDRHENEKEGCSAARVLRMFSPVVASRPVACGMDVIGYPWLWTDGAHSTRLGRIVAVFEYNLEVLFQFKPTPIPEQELYPTRTLSTSRSPLQDPLLARCQVHPTWATYARVV